VSQNKMGHFIFIFTLRLCPSHAERYCNILTIWQYLCY